MEITKISQFEYKFIFDNADHTLGNLLQKELLKDPNVVFAGYTKPHYHETKMIILLITSDKSPKEIMTNTFNNIIVKLDTLVMN